MHVGIRREDKNQWEARVPLTPRHVRELLARGGLSFTIQPSTIRAFKDDEYAAAGARLAEDLGACDLIVAVKEIPADLLMPDKSYLFFSHTIKGQQHNMPMLRRLLQLGCQLFDYERVVDDAGRRLIFFGRHAGLAGMIDTLWTLGRRLDWEGLASPFSRIQPAHHYGSSERARPDLAALARDIAAGGLPEALGPVVCGFAGYGNVSQGAQHIFDQLPHREIAPDDLPALRPDPAEARRTLYKVVFKEEHMAEPAAPGARFDLQDYYQHPDAYRGRFEPFVEHLTLLVNCIYWTAKYPRLVSLPLLKKLYAAGRRPRLRVIGDISCDINGSIECTVRATDPGAPVYVYDPAEARTIDGVAGHGPVVLAVDTLPCELPIESSEAFGDALAQLLPEMAQADLSADLERSGLPPPLRRAAIVYHGRLTPEYKYLEPFVMS